MGGDFCCLGLSLVTLLSLTPTSSSSATLQSPSSTTSDPPTTSNVEQPGATQSRLRFSQNPEYLRKLLFFYCCLVYIDIPWNGIAQHQHLGRNDEPPTKPSSESTPPASSSSSPLSSTSASPPTTRPALLPQGPPRQSLPPTLPT
ncbi:hypothetical protein BJ508DRAFT_333051 [Ascobolus immersus RN42]|uniref:Uncharacterized protein n=1 Tax=Ascobolus immersus RN42 TaxID=1160509 RepID=A0A3N4HMK5_ASCIM|nr:hypothetical protein BJ508DRAFT_333051 [Ascobolus immersus RN42]